MTNKQWGDNERAVWFSEQSIKRSYADEVLSKIEVLKESYCVEQYGSLSYIANRYPLLVVKTRAWDEAKPTVLITGGVHGYETSGVQGVLRFLSKEADKYSQHFNFVGAPCVSPWGYETINRWNAKAADPNRSFFTDSPAEESATLMNIVSELGCHFIAHFDLHETTDTDNTVFMPALASRDAKELIIWEIPDGFYTVGDSENPVPEFQKAIIDSVQNVTHIAPSDNQGNLIGEHSSQNGVIYYATSKLGLCTGFTHAQYSTTTEVYPDSDKVTDEICIRAQVAAIKGGLDYIIQNK